MELDHGAVEQERSLVREPLGSDLVSVGEPLVECHDVGAGHDEVDVAVVARRFQTEELPAPTTHECDLEPGLLDKAERLDGPGSVRHVESIAPHDHH